MNLNLRPGLLEMALVGLSLSIGWGIRGNYGHEYGAMIPGALAAMSVVLLSGRSDWQRRIPFFALFGAVGWSFGGSMSYGQVIAYTHSGHSPTVLYGFACLYVIGFLWGALGGAGTALPAVLSRARVTEYFAPMGAVFLAWLLEDIIVATWFNVEPTRRHESPLYWYDTDWLAALLAIVAVLALGLVRRRFDSASSLVLHLAIGWWIGFLVLVNLLGLRMTPPRGDNWAGCVGMVVSLWFYCWKHGMAHVAHASLLSGLVGGLGFATAQLLKLVGITTALQTNWHSLLEQTYGFVNGVGIALAMFFLARRTPEVEEKPAARHWAGPCAIGFVLLGITYLNLRKNPETWATAKSVPALLYGLSGAFWFDMAYLAIAIAFATLVIAHRRKPLAFLPADWLGRGELMYLIFLWWVVVGNFERALVAFAPVRLITEGVIHINAALCTVGVAMRARSNGSGSISPIPEWAGVLHRLIVVGLTVAILSVATDWAIVRVVYGNQPAPHSSRHIRFGPDATATKAKPQTGQPHP